MSQTKTSASLRERLTEIIEHEWNQIPDDKRDPLREFYYKNYQDNLIYDMDEVHRIEYGDGSGSELKSKGDKPAKMASLVSSSAMTFNILGNHFITMKHDTPFEPGLYSVQYEKQLYTLNKGSSPANLDACLIHDDGKDAIFCEMKMLEWLGTPGVLKEAYLEQDLYFDKEAYLVFSSIARTMIDNQKRTSNEGYKSVFQKYDAWQMFKHTLAIYNHTSRITKEGVNQKAENVTMADQFKRVVLANVVFEMDEAAIADECLKKQYRKTVTTEREEAKEFIGIMLDSKNGLKELFQKHCGIEFDIRYIPVNEFVAYMYKTDAELQALKRYGCKQEK